jgi:hypothetical protein
LRQSRERVDFTTVFWLADIEVGTGCVDTVSVAVVVIVEAVVTDLEGAPGVGATVRVSAADQLIAVIVDLVGAIFGE